MSPVGYNKIPICGGREKVANWTTVQVFRPAASREKAIKEQKRRVGLNVGQKAARAGAK